MPLTEQTNGVADVNATGNPELAVALKAPVVPADTAGAAPKVMVCAVLPVVTVIDFVLGVAGAYVPLPVWLAVTVQVPVARPVSWLPEMAHLPGVVMSA